MPYGAHGYGAAFTLSVMDREYVKGLSQDEALGIIDNCIKELHTRFLIAQKNFVIKVRYICVVRLCSNMVLLGIPPNSDVVISEEFFSNHKRFIYIVGKFDRGVKSVAPFEMIHRLGISPENHTVLHWLWQRWICFSFPWLTRS